jgi:hypothetical protein
VKLPTNNMQKHFSGVLITLGVNERFGLGRVLEIYPLRSFKFRIFICLDYPLRIFIFDEMRVSANRCVIN